MMNRNGFANERSHIYAANPIAIRGQHPSLQSPYANHKFGIRCALLLDSLPTPLAPTLPPSRSHTAGRGIHRRRIANMHHRFLPPKFPNRLAWHNTIPSDARVTTTDKGVASLAPTSCPTAQRTSKMRCQNVLNLQICVIKERPAQVQPPWAPRSWTCRVRQSGPPPSRCH